MKTSMIETELLRCPDCESALDASLQCHGCGRRLVQQSGVYDLLPKRLDVTKKNEDLVFAVDGAEDRSTRTKPWRRIVGRHEVLRFDDEIVELFPKGRFLELGGETCFASAIYKSTFPDSVVYASDVSPNALSQAAIPTSGLFPRQPDFFVALDAERIPFKDESVDCVLAMTMMHHLPDPVKMLREVRRILKRGGRFVAVDAAVPHHFRWLFSATARARSSQYGIQESLIPYLKWASIVRESGYPLDSLHVYTNPEYQYEAVHVLAGRLIRRLPLRVARRLFPVGIMIIYDKE